MLGIKGGKGGTHRVPAKKGNVTKRNERFRAGGKSTPAYLSKTREERKGIPKEGKRIAARLEKRNQQGKDGK